MKNWAGGGAGGGWGWVSDRWVKQTISSLPSEELPWHCLLFLCSYLTLYIIYLQDSGWPKFIIKSIPINVYSDLRTHKFRILQGLVQISFSPEQSELNGCLIGGWHQATNGLILQEVPCPGHPEHWKAEGCLSSFLPGKERCFAFPSADGILLTEQLCVALLITGG